MTGINELADQALRTAKKIKTANVAAGDEAFEPTVLCFRGGKLIATVAVNTADIQQFLRAVDMSVVGFAADAATVAVEGYVAFARPATSFAPARDLMTDPDTGQPWGPGGIEQYAERHGPGNGVVETALSVCTVNAAHDVAVRVAPFVVAGTDVTWITRDSPHDVPPGVSGAPGGDIVDGLLDAMNASITMSTQRAAEAATRNITHEAAIAITDLAALHYLDTNFDVVVAIAGTDGDSERARILKSMSRTNERDA